MNVRKPVKQAFAAIERKLGKRIENGIVAFNDNHNQIIKRTFEKIDQFGQSYNGGPPVDSQFGRTLDRIGDKVGRSVFGFVAWGDNMNQHCPRCKNKWTRYHPNGWSGCDDCDLHYEALSGKVYMIRDSTRIQWDIDKHTCSINTRWSVGGRTAKKIAWLPFDFTNGEIDKYLVLL